MSDGWLDPSKYEQLPILGCTGPGTMAGGYAWKVVLHTTESRPGTLDAVNALFLAKPCYAPQFALDVASRRRVQYIPWTWSAAALKGCHRGWETNRGCAVQAEIVGFAADSPTWPDEWLWEIADWLADLVRDGLQVDLGRVFDFPAMEGVLAVEDSQYRLSEPQYQGENGILGHVNLHCNEHWDPGKLNGARIAELAQGILGGTASAPTSWVVYPLDPAVRPPSSVRTEYIALGMEGGIVKFAQELLAGLGFDLGPAGADGIFGEATEAAAKAFQSSVGLEPDGIIGPLTQAAVTRAYGGSTDVADPSAPAFPGRYLLVQDPLLRGEDVSTWQSKMSARGWTLGVDGVYGPESAGQCTQFQSEHQLAVDGVVGPLTWAATWTSPVT